MTIVVLRVTRRVDLGGCHFPGPARNRNHRLDQAKHAMDPAMLGFVCLPLILSLGTKCPWHYVCLRWALHVVLMLICIALIDMSAASPAFLRYPVVVAVSLVVFGSAARFGRELFA